MESSGGQTLPDNGLIVITNANRVPDFRCLSGSSSRNIGKLIGPLGNDITYSHSNPFLVTQQNPGSLYVRNVRPLQLVDVGIYTYRTPDENGDIVDFNFGLYHASESELSS